jgi:uncharacterized repeat protein (TIGR03806 family)
MLLPMKLDYRKKKLLFILGLKNIFFVILAISIIHCKKNTSVNLFLEEPFPQKLSEWNLFVGKLSDLKPNKGVVPYELNMPLFTDYASKSRFIWMPNGKSAKYKENETFVFPVGTIISKTFFFQGASVGDPAHINKLIETRLLIHTESGWVAIPYIWDKDLNDARLEITGGKHNLSYQDSTGKKQELNYIIPNTNQCKGCHENQKQLQPIGPKAKNLNRLFAYEDGIENQLVRWKKIGYLSDLPDSIENLTSFPDINSTNKENISELARSYLDVNCGHCHNPDGPANTSGLMLNYAETDRKKLGFCKTPVASGKGSGKLLFDIVPGNPTESILFYRMNSKEPDVMMPELGRSIIHKEGVDLIRKWIESERGSCI